MTFSHDWFELSIVIHTILPALTKWYVPIYLSLCQRRQSDKAQ